MNKLNLLVLSGIVILAIFLRFYQLDSVPPSASLDEASIGWNAYSILQTGKDEYGTPFPILLRAYDDYRPALYAYTVIPFIKVFGLSTLAVRLPSVILSVLTVMAVYFLVKEMFKNQKVIKGEYLALCVSFFLAISPWHIYISRLGHEVNLAFSCFIFALVFFLRKNIYLSALFFVISFVSYQTEKIFIPLILLAILVIYKTDLINLKKKVLISIILSLTVLIPFTKETFSENALIRLSGTNVFEANKSRYIEQSFLLEKAVLEKDIVGRIIYNRRVLSLQILTEGYLSHFDPVWLFTNPDSDKHKIPNLGLLYWWLAPFLLVGMYILLRGEFDNKIKKLVFVWFLTAPIAASITTDSPHALRSFVFLPTWEIFYSLGILYIYNFIRKGNPRKIFVLVLGVLVVFSTAYLYKYYFFVFPQLQSDSFQYALSKAIPYVISNEKKYEKVIFDNNTHLSQSYMFFLFYTKYDPVLYQSLGGTVAGGYDAVHKIGKYEFRPINMINETENNLFIGDYQQFIFNGKLAAQVMVLKEIDNLNDKKTIQIITKNK